MLFEKQIAFLKTFEALINRQLQQTIQQNNMILKDVLINQQLFEKGIDGKGKKLEAYKRTTIRMKISKGQPVDRTTLKDEGDFHASVEIQADSQSFTISSDVSHDKYIVKRYGKDVLRITDENIKEFMLKYVKISYVKILFNDIICKDVI